MEKEKRLVHAPYGNEGYCYCGKYHCLVWYNGPTLTEEEHPIPYPECVQYDCIFHPYVL